MSQYLILQGSTLQDIDGLDLPLPAPGAAGSLSKLKPKSDTRPGSVVRACFSVMRAKWLARVYSVYTKGGDMRVKVRQVGNSLTVTLPKEIALEMNLSSDMEVDLKVRDQVVVLEPVLPPWERLLTEVRRQAAERGLSEADVERALAESRGPRT